MELIVTKKQLRAVPAIEHPARDVKRLTDGRQLDFGRPHRREPGRYAHPMQALWARLVNRPGPYPQRMLIDQLTYLQGMLVRADQKVGRDAHQRFADLSAELSAISQEIGKITGTAAVRGR